LHVQPLEWLRIKQSGAQIVPARSFGFSSQSLRMTGQSVVVMNADSISLQSNF